MPQKNHVKMTNERLFDGTLTVGQNAIALPDIGGNRVTSVLAQADPDNGNNVFIGNVGSQSIELIAGAAEVINIDNPSKIWVRAAAGNQRVNWHAIGGKP